MLISQCLVGAANKQMVGLIVGDLLKLKKVELIWIHYSHNVEFVVIWTICVITYKDLNNAVECFVGEILCSRTCQEGF